MKSKLLFFDLAICSVWLLSMFGGKGRGVIIMRRSEKMIKKCLHVYFCCSHSSFMKEKNSTFVR